jgi:alkylation response protein AidB-like acyl-CoA dehydrogenase
MDFTRTEDQQAIASLAHQVFSDHATVDRIKQVETSDERVDRALWKALAETGLLGIPLPEDCGGSGMGFAEVALILEEQGRRVAPVPLLETVVLGAMPIAEFGTREQRSAWLPGVVNGDVILTGALEALGADIMTPPAEAVRVGRAWRLTGELIGVPAAHVAARILVPARAPEGVSIWLVDPNGPGVQRESAQTTNREYHSYLRLDHAEAELLGDRVGGEAMLRWVLDRALVAVSAVQVGVTAEAVRIAADYTSKRQQFGRPLSTFQGVAMRAADSYIDNEAMRVTMQRAAWLLSTGRDASTAVEISKWWASEAGHRIVYQTQYLQGGMGSDIDYPSHRYFIWGMQLAGMFGGGAYHLSVLGRRLAAERVS